MRQKRILTFANHIGPVGGSEIAQLNISRGLVARGWEIHLLYISSGEFWSEWQALAATTTRIGASLPARSSPVASTFGVLRAGVAGIRRWPSVIYVHNAGDVPIGLGVAKVAGASVVAHLHLPPASRQPNWLNALIRRTEVVIAPSSDTAGRWVTAAKLVPDRISVIPTGVDIDRFAPLVTDQRAAVRVEIGVGIDEPMVLYAGRLTPEKGAHYLIEAVRRLPVHVVLCGLASDKAYLARLRKEAIASNATFLGLRSDVASLMGAADLVVVPSNWPEPQGLVISEALACGTPVIAFNAGGIADSMKGFPGQLVAPGDPWQLAKVIERYFDWRSSEPELGERSRRWAVEHMSLDASTAMVDKILTRVLDDGR
jgi:glycosyltransferase involved in cell wall biosynthesis